MKLKINACTLLATILLVLVSTPAVAQSPEPKLNDLLERRWFEQKRPERSSSLTLSSMEALAVPDEEEALAKFSKSSPDFEQVFEDVVADARQSLVVVRSKGVSRSKTAAKRAIALGTVSYTHLTLPTKRIV